MVLDTYSHVVSMWKQKRIQTDAQLVEVLNCKSIAFAYHSCKIENDNVTYNDVREIFEHYKVSSYTGDLKTLYEIYNSKMAYEMFLTAFNQKLRLNESLIKNFQKLLTENTYDIRRCQLGERPGEYKQHDFVTGGEEVGAIPEDVKEEMDELIEEMQDISDEIALKAAAYFHVKFENIHPFADGNGRTGRLLMNYILVLNRHPFIIIHEEDRKSYYTALASWDKNQDIEPMVNFLKEQTIKTWKNQI